MLIFQPAICLFGWPLRRPGYRSCHWVWETQKVFFSVSEDMGTTTGLVFYRNSMVFVFIYGDSMVLDRFLVLSGFYRDSIMVLYHFFLPRMWWVFFDDFGHDGSNLRKQTKKTDSTWIEGMHQKHIFYPREKKMQWGSVGFLKDTRTQ